MAHNTNKHYKLFLFGKQRDEIGTPKELLKELNKEFHFDFDPCPLKRPKWDGLTVDWGESNYVNPPYSQIPKWLQKGITEMKKGNKSVFLVPARTNTKYWHELIAPNATEIRFLYRGIAFEGYKDPLAIPLAIIIFDPNDEPKYQVIQKRTYSYFKHE